MTASSNFMTAANGVLVAQNGQTFGANANGLAVVAVPTDSGVAPRTGAGPSGVPTPLGQCFNDSTLSAFCWYVGMQLSSTGWVNSSGVAV